MEQVSDPSVVFVVHGRNEKARAALFAFLRSIGLKPLEWAQAIQETRSGSPFIGEVLDAAFSKAQAIVVLITPDDEARLREQYRSPHDPLYESQLTGQARPNVLFEAGMAMGRNPDRTIITELGTTRPFSDVAGRHIVRLTNESAARQDLAQRLMTAGCPVDISGRDWHREGDFQVASVDSGAATKHDTRKAGSQTASQAIQELDETQVEILLLLSRHNDTLYQPELERSLTVKKTVIGFHLQELEEQGYIELRRPMLTRPLICALTQKGRHYLISHSLI